MKKEKLFKVRYRWHAVNTNELYTQIVNDATLKKMEKSTKFIIISIKEY